MEHTIAVTGHRPDKLWGYDLNKYGWKRLRIYFVRELMKHKATDAWSGMALGVDAVFAQSVLILRDSGYNIRLHCAIPCRNHSSNWFPESVEMYNSILSEAYEVKLVTDKPYNPYLMQIRNQYMVDNSDEVLAIWNGTPGGTANCVNYARKQNVPVTIVNPVKFEKKRFGRV